METRTEKREKIQTPTLVAIVVGLHVVALGSVVFIQGCGTTRTHEVEPPKAAVMPPGDEVAVRDAGRSSAPPPVFRPPVAVDEAPTRMPPADPHVYEVRRGDNLSSIAQRHGVTTAEIVDLNQLSDPNAIRIGQKLLLPSHATVREASARPPADRPAPSRTPDGKKYVIQSGDNLSTIASRHGVTVAALSQANNISDPNRIRVGQEIVIPGASGEQTDRPSAARRAVAETSQEPREEAEEDEPTLSLEPAEPEFTLDAEPIAHTVRAGETFESIARDYVVLKDDILRANNMSGDETLRPGQTLMIPPMR